MIEILKNVALTIAIIGFGLAVLLPILLQLLYTTLSYLAFTSSSPSWKDLLVNVMWIISTVIGSFLYGLYYIGCLYVIWL